MNSRKKDRADVDSTIESTMSSLEAQLEKLENQEISLEEALSAFELGITLTRSAQKKLSEAEQKVQLLLEKDSGPTESAFDLNEENG